MCCSVLQCVAVCCSVLQCVAVCNVWSACVSCVQCVACVQNNDEARLSRLYNSCPEVVKDSCCEVQNEMTQSCKRNDKMFKKK